MIYKYFKANWIKVTLSYFTAFLRAAIHPNYPSMGMFSYVCGIDYISMVDGSGLNHKLWNEQPSCRGVQC